MKIRNGFISNSSSSSFVIQIKEIIPQDKNKVANIEDIKKAIDFGFSISDTGSPFYVENKPYHNEETEQDIKDAYFLKYSIICNQDEVIDFLIKNNIPFTASVHYGHQYYQFEKDSDKLIIITNLAEIAHMYGVDSAKKELENKEDLIQEIPI